MYLVRLDELDIAHGQTHFSHRTVDVALFYPTSVLDSSNSGGLRDHSSQPVLKLSRYRIYCVAFHWTHPELQCKSKNYISGNATHRQAV